MIRNAFDHFMQTSPSAWDLEECFVIYRSADASLSIHDVTTKIQQDLTRVAELRPHLTNKADSLSATLKILDNISRSEKTVLTTVKIADRWESNGKVTVNQYGSQSTSSGEPLSKRKVHDSTTPLRFRLDQIMLLSAELEAGNIDSDERTEAWLIGRIWGMVDKAFNDLKLFDVSRGEKSCQASSVRKNKSRVPQGADALQRKKMGRRLDIILKRLRLEGEGLETTKSLEGHVVVVEAAYIGEVYGKRDGSWNVAIRPKDVLAVDGYTCILHLSRLKDAYCCCPQLRRTSWIITNRTVHGMVRKDHHTTFLRSIELRRYRF
ncbi:hypothetical protein O0I10_010524 [Lichtheimia ornata]|uniref:Uncharacterized protein n=1 Tax=Lichtheimia ornata TaxID=688661 RepID=A0AAD7XUZ5_9FUNG|nr:uncharacterized protein O0I10_010524 [Lichtheimia ornata]KAJ8653843.1 hypothetical protein O0I10_010524 [Lichtheimia ornata]